ncbi:hypothetical protein NQ317_004284 [Molorchus minor]|uniref:Peptidase S1 domain-containing protein n=1 Tax=Molorchus minor TaxID=1323400 RepID=A0ABQ9JGJ5_9CUCU|nr:hypothetical protein NQ317_004284 [Molorchus minor]
MIRLIILPALLVTGLGVYVLGAPRTENVPLLDGRIVGGEDADIADYSYQLSLLLLGFHICGAVAISSTWALTAAHCVDGATTLLLSVRAGSSIRNYGGQVVSVTEARMHPEYNIFIIDYDIATLRLSSELDTVNTRPIPLPNFGLKPPAGSTAVITGWGTTAEGGNPSRLLQVIRVPVISQEDCRYAYSHEIITDRMFCAGLLGIGGQDACQGDSGGPVVVDGIVVGLVSWGDGCARPERPGVYSSVPALRNWILENTGL